MNDPFQTLELEPRFDLDLEQLGRRHRDLSLALHPDRFADQGPRERRAALGRAIEVNAASRTLRDPVSRAEALLRRFGVEVGEGKEPAAAPDLLFSMMERREALRDAQRASDKAAVLRLSEEVRAEEQVVLDRLGQRFERLSESDLTTATEIVKDLGALRYFRRFFDEVGSILDEFD